MQTGEIDRVDTVQAGQLWKVEHGYVQVVEMGKRLIHYKMLRHPKQRAAVTRMISLEALLKYLQETEAQLVR